MVCCGDAEAIACVAIADKCADALGIDPGVRSWTLARSVRREMSAIALDSSPGAAAYKSQRADLPVQ
jgi:hypothetical protein